MQNIQEKYKKFLPIGSVVLLENATKRLMITGYCVSEKENPDTIFDYSGCLYPEGFLSSDKNCLFNHNQIAKIFCIGYSDDEQKQFIENLNKIING